VHRAEPERFRHQFNWGARAAGRGIARVGHIAVTRSGLAGRAVAGRVGSRVARDRVGERDATDEAHEADEAAAVTDLAASEVSTETRDDAIAGRAAASAALPDPAPAVEPGPMRARSVASAADRARAAIGPGVAGNLAAAERGREVVPSAGEARRGRTELLSAAVLVLALLGAVLAFGGLNLAHAAGASGAGGSSGLESN
jgi:hypothetical protein